MKDVAMTAAQILGALSGLIIGAWGLWCTWVAFFGGTLPIPFVVWESPGDFWLGLLFLFVITPVLTAIASQLLVWILGAILLVASSIANSSSSTER